MTGEGSDDRQFHQASTLRDGTPVTIRTVHPDDRERLVAAFDKLEPGTVYSRFFSFRKEIPAQALDRIAAIDFDHLAALVATVGSDDGETVIGGASYVVHTAADGAKVAEIAFTIEEDYQGQGLGGQLMAAMTTLARRHGIARFEADVLAGNGGMLTVFQRSGLPLRRHNEHGVVSITMDLAPPKSNP